MRVVRLVCRRILPAIVLGATGVAATPAAAAVIAPFDTAPVAAAELAGVRGGTLDLGMVNRLTREQLEAFDRQTAGILTTTFDNWLFDVGLPLIAANIGR